MRVATVAISRERFESDPSAKVRLAVDCAMQVYKASGVRPKSKSEVRELALSAVFDESNTREPLGNIWATIEYKVSDK